MRMLSMCLIICQVFLGSQGESCESEHCNFFDFRLLQAACDDNDLANAIVAPVSVKVSLMALLEGSVGKTRQEILSSLKLSSDMENIRQEACDALIPFQGLESGVQCEMTSCLWFDESIEIFDNYTEIIENYYNSSYEIVDFKNSTNSVEIINEWINATTMNNSESMINNGELSKNTLIVMTSALRFKGDWHYGFYEDSHWNGCYEIPEYGCQAVRIMHNRYEHNYAMIEYLDAEVVEVPFVNERFSLLLFRPKTKGFFDLNNLIKKLARTPISEILSRLEEVELDLVLPIFHIEARTDVVPLLKNMGIKSLFDKTANLSGMLQKSQVGIDNMFYNVELEMHTVGEIDAEESYQFMFETPDDPCKYIEIDRPFVFAILDTSSQGVLFAGRIVHPEYDLAHVIEHSEPDMYSSFPFHPYMGDY